MGGSGLTLGPAALLLGVLAYVLKRWWDSADSITTERRRAYLAYFEECYQLTIKAFEIGSLPSDQDRNVACAGVHRVTPDFYLHASPEILDISDIFFGRAVALLSANAPEKGSDEFMQDAVEVQEALNALREKMKSELFTVSPRFQYERWTRRAKWKAFLEENKK